MCHLEPLWEGNTCGHEVMHLYVCWSSVPALHHGRSIWLHSYAILCRIWILWSTRCAYQIAECVLIVYVTYSLKCVFCNLIGAPSGSWKSDPGQKRCTSEARPSFLWVEGLTHQTACLLSKHSQAHTQSDLLINQNKVHISCHLWSLSLSLTQTWHIMLLEW